MADEFDHAQELNLLENENFHLKARQAIVGIPKGVPGICDNCGEDCKRLVRAHCAPCRDGLGLP